ncbi:MAG: Hamiltonella virus [Pseudomonadota bacterium]
MTDGSRHHNTTHGMSGHPAFWVWRSMRDRCRLPTHQAWANYGGRGIRVCSRWEESFENFWADMGPTYAQGLDLNRIDNNGGYSSENCDWINREGNCNNKRNNRILQTASGPMTAARAARKYGVGITTVLYRLEHGYTDAEALAPENKVTLVMCPPACPRPTKSGRLWSTPEGTPMYLAMDSLGLRRNTGRHRADNGHSMNVVLHGVCTTCSTAGLGIASLCVASQDRS